MSTYARLALPVPLHPVDTLFDYRVPDDLRGKVQVGSLVEVNFAGRKLAGVVVELSDETSVPEKKIKALSALKLDQAVLSAERLGFLKELSSYYYYPLGEVFETAVPSAVRKASIKLLQKESVPKKKKSAKEFLTLNEEQEKALQGILSSDQSEHLLWGVTGSGKTEVYLHLIRKLHAEGKSALVLVPEIALTPLLFSRFEERFPGELAVFHSAQRPAKQRSEWLDVLNGRKKIAVGPRSALFAPLSNLGAIIVDEEHDSSYKQEERLRYNARNECARLAKRFGAKVVYGSATPSAESFFAVEQGRCVLHKLRQRAVSAARLPEIELVDMKKGLAVENLDPIAAPRQEKEFSKPETRETFFISPTLEEELEKTLSNKKQAILFLNRRGLARHVFCSSCGHIPECPSCEVTLTPHANKLLCHYCHYEQMHPEACPSCGAKDSFRQVGFGTQGVVNAIETLFPKARILRMDRDVVSKAGELEKTVEDFGQGKADILVGTQMVAKGHDFPNVTLVGILLAELGLSVPDFRAEEKTLQLLLQVSGRAGRGKDPGKVVIQTFSPELSSLQFIKTHTKLDDYQEFVSSELMKRGALLYPPSAALTMLRLDGTQESGVFRAAQAVGNALKGAAGDHFHVLGPAPSPLSRIRGRFRYQILLKGREPDKINKAVDWILGSWVEKKLEREYRTRLLVDVDPVQML